MDAGAAPPSPRAELYRALGALAEEPRAEHRRLAELLGLPEVPEVDIFTDLFLLNLYPYASVHLGTEGMLGGEARDRVAGFWGALGILPPPEPDHLGTLLGLLAELVEREAAEEEPAARLLLGRARSALLREHLEPWLPAFLDRVKELGGAYYGGWAELLLQALRDEAARSDDLPADAERSGQRALPLHLRGVPSLPDPRMVAAEPQGSPRDDGGIPAGPGSGTPQEVPAPLDPPSPDSPGEAFLKALLAPVRSGMIVTRSDLARAARELGLGGRMGERLYILKALLGQDAPATLRWLADEARRAGARHREARGFHREVMEWWEERAGETARLLDELAADAASPGEDP